MQEGKYAMTHYQGMTDMPFQWFHLLRNSLQNKTGGIKRDLLLALLSFWPLQGAESVTF